MSVAKKFQTVLILNFQFCQIQGIRTEITTESTGGERAVLQFLKD